MLNIAALPSPTIASGATAPAASTARPSDGGAAATPAAPRPLNPALRLDAALGLVVLEFQGLGEEPNTIPNARELEAYRAAGRAGAADQASSASSPAPAPSPASLPAAAKT